MTTCPCCSDKMLRHIRGNQIYWFCRHCWQKMPTLISCQQNLSPSPILFRSVGLKKPLSLLEDV
jgi:primosomal protein N'